jgi:hypothetical protein
MPTLNAHYRGLLAAIANGSTMTTNGAATAEVCWNWTLYGNGGNPRDPESLFSLINLANGDPYGLLNNMRQGVQGYWEKRWANRQLRKAGSGGKYTPQYMVTKIMKRVIGQAGLSLAGAPTDYRVCMHWPTADGITYEHWWLEVCGVTVEKISRWHDCMVYTRGADPGHYSTVRLYVNGLHQRQINRIQNILDNGAVIPTPPGGWSLSAVPTYTVPK